jgi:hypothetical protein
VHVTKIVLRPGGSLAANCPSMLAGTWHSDTHQPAENVTLLISQ